MNKPHKHSALIKAWADGAEIQYKNAELEWKDFPKGYVTWDEREEYRIKPKELKIEAGKFYKTRDGHKAKIYEVYDGDIHGAIFKDDCWVPLYWQIKGNHFMRGEYDLISEWVETHQEEKASVELKIEVGKYYKNRNGCKVKIYEIYDNNIEDFYKLHFYEIHGAVFENRAWHVGSWTKKGENLFEETTPYDIIGEWEE
jgi:hypothetical protein